MVIPLKETAMDPSRTVYFHTCEDKNCNGTIIVEYQPSIKASSRYRPETSDLPPCPICGGDMKISTMNAVEQDLIPDPGWPGQVQFHVTLYTRTLFVPTVKRPGRQSNSVTSENEAQNSPSPLTDRLKALEEGFFTDDDLAKLFKVSTRVVATWVRDGRIRPVRLTEKKKRLYTKAIVEEFIDRESDLIALKGKRTGKIPATRPRKSMSIEESRKLVKSIRDKSRSDE